MEEHEGVMEAAAELETVGLQDSRRKESRIDERVAKEAEIEEIPEK